MGERCRLRDPRMIKNLNNLADIHRLNKNLSRAIKIINEVLAQDPKNEQALGLLEKIHVQKNQ
jgi:beta-galactosidase beta subunit